ARGRYRRHGALSRVRPRPQVPERRLGRGRAGGRGGPRGRAADGPPAGGRRLMRIGYVLKNYPRLSQTFVVHELRAHERAGLPVPIFALRPPKPEDRDVVQPPLAAEVVQLPGPERELPAQLATAARARGVTHLHAHFAKLATGVARAAAAE